MTLRSAAIVGAATAALCVPAARAAPALPLREKDPAAAKTQMRSICSSVWVDIGERDLKLDDMEKRLVCGDQTDDAIGRPWANVPPSQAAFFMKSFLQSRGRHKPEFSYDGDDLFVRGGPESHLSSFEVIRPEVELRLPRKREIAGRLLDPKLLNDLESWGQGELRHQGYPCGRSGAEADPESGAVRLRLQPGQRKRVLAVHDVQSTGLEAFILDRYNAFEVGQWYDQRLVELTRRRTMEEGLLESISLNPRCEPAGAVIDRDAALGPPRQAKIGVGASTEEGPSARASLRFLRLDGRASQAQALLDASFRRQRAESSVRWRYSERFTRSYLEPRVRFERNDEPSYEAQTTSAGAAHGWTFEFDSGSAAATLGPAWQETFVARGAGPGRESYFLAEGGASWQSHDYEYFRTSPREGSQADLRVLATKREWGAGFSAQKISASGQYLWDMVDVDPPLAILALRWRLGTTFVSGDSSPAQLPLPFRFFGGGIRDLRGFDRQGLPPGGQGALTEALASLELRFFRGLFRRVDPFAFVDAGEFGGQNAQLDPIVFWSPGFGLRYESPFGVFRAFLARGQIDGAPDGYQTPVRQWRAGLTFGEEF